MSEHGNMVMEEKRMRKASSVQGHESAWLGRWSQLGNEVKFHDQSKDLIKPEDKIPDQEVLPFPMFKVSQKRDVGSSSKAVVANRMPWMNALGEKEKLSSSSNRLDFPIQEQTTQNLLELIRPVRFYATVDTVQRVSGEINLPEEDGHQLLKGSMKLKGKIFGGYLDPFPDVDHQHRGGVRLQSLESSKDTEEDGLRQNESSAETDILEMDKLQTIHLSGILKVFSLAAFLSLFSYVSDSHSPWQAPFHHRQLRYIYIYIIQSTQNPIFGSCGYERCRDLYLLVLKISVGQRKNRRFSHS